MQPRAGLDRHYGWAVAADPGDPAAWYVGLAPGPSQAHGSKGAQAAIFRREGNKWRRLAGGLPDPLPHMPYALITHVREPGALYAGMSSGEIWYSGDRGDSWARLPLCLPSIRRTLVIV